MTSAVRDSREQRAERMLLSLCGRRELEASAIGPDGVEGIHRLLELASDGDVAGLTLSRLLATGLELPDALRESLVSSLEDRRRRARVWILERDRVAGALAREGLDPVMLKGAALSTEWYEEAAHREFGDLDLLVPEPRLRDSLEVLRGAGYAMTGDEEVSAAYRRHHFHYRLVHPAGFVVELHWGLTRPGSLFPLDPARFLERSRTVAGRPFRIPAPEHMVLHSLHQSLGGGHVQLRRLVDVDRVMGSEDSPRGQELVWEARRTRLGHALWLALRLAREELGTPVDPELAAELEPGGPTRLHLRLLDPSSALLDRRMEERVVLSDLLQLWLLPDASVRLRHLRRLGSGSEDPMGHLWHPASTAGTDSRLRTVAGGIGRLAKLATAQCLLYLSAVGDGGPRRPR